MIPDSAVKAIQDSVKTEVLQIDGVNYTTRQVFDTRHKDPQPDTLKVATLTGFLDYLTGNIDSLSKDGLIILVESPTTVRLLSKLYGRFQQRNTYLEAAFEPLIGEAFRFGNFYDVETFIIGLQAFFVPTPERDAVLALVGNIKEEAVKQHSDDGITQTVVARAGVAKVAEVEVPNPVTLKPYRTFREIDQPESRFILRMRQGQQGQKPTAALFEAEGGVWKLNAIARVANFITEHVKDVPIIA